MRKRICGVTIFICLIAYILIGYYGTKANFNHPWAYGALVFLLVPLMPVLLGLKKLYFSYTLIVIIAYLVIGFVFHGWHPWWVLFLTIPVYYGIVGPNFIHVKKTDKNEKKEKDDVEIL